MSAEQLDLWSKVPEPEAPSQLEPDPRVSRARGRSSPFEGLQPALRLISTEARVLPATGQAMEDLVRPDHEEVIDRLRSGDQAHLDQILETPNRSPYVPLQQLHRTEKHLLRYFLDGSARTFFLGDVIEGQRRSAVHVSQVGVAAIFREDDGRVRTAASINRIYLMMDRNEVSFGDKVASLIEAAGPPYKFHDTMEADGETEKSAPGRESRSRAAHKAHHLMATEEEQLGRMLPREDHDWLVLDGSLGKDLHSWRNVPSFFGLTKSFSREPMFKLPGLTGRRVNLYELLANLNFSARTCAYAARSGTVVMWYVRLREQRMLDYPLMGVVKVEYPNPTAQAVPSELIDEISSALVAERQVTPHGNDVRWHAHLYTIHLAEQAIKNGFHSTEALKAGIRWPIFERGRTS